MTYNFVVSAPIICCSYENLYCNNASIRSEWHHCHTHQSLSSVSLLSALALMSFCVNVLAFLSVGWLALRGLVCCKQCLTITFT